MNNYAKGPVDSLSRNSFLDALDEMAGAQGQNDFVRQLSDPVYFALLDTHEQLQTDKQGNRLREMVSVPDTTNLHSKTIYERFVTRAKKINRGKQPTVVVITASSRDFFESADFYEGVMTSSGANVVWLPLSAAWQHAQADAMLGKDTCPLMSEYHAKHNLFDVERRYPLRFQWESDLCRHPQKVSQIINSAHGVFFNGGDQSRTLAALLTPTGQESPALKTIRNKLKSKDIVVGGTSAGTAVQAGGHFLGYPVPMLTNGTSVAAFERGVLFVNAPSARCSASTSTADCATAIQPDDVTVRSAGGTGLFSFGLLDTHFSERNREARLALATFSSHQRFGFGVDETTALLVAIQGETAAFEVIGAGGVFVADMAEQSFQQSRQNGQMIRQLGGIAHFWPAGTTADDSDTGLIVQLPSERMNSTVRKRDDEGKWRSQLRLRCEPHSPHSWQYEGLQVVTASAENSLFSESERDCGYTHLPFVIKN